MLYLQTKRDTNEVCLIQSPAKGSWFVSAFASFGSAVLALIGIVVRPIKHSIEKGMELRNVSQKLLFSPCMLKSKWKAISEPHFF
jgi:hypothetical protein